MRYHLVDKPGITYYQNCDYCGRFHLCEHLCEWEGCKGDCENDRNYFTDEELDTKHGIHGWLLQCFAQLEVVND